MNEQRCLLPPFRLCTLTGPLGGVSIGEHHFQTPILRITSVSKNPLTAFPSGQHHSFLMHLQFRTARLQQLDKLFPFACLCSCLCVCFRPRSRAWQRRESMWQRSRWNSWPTLQAFQGRVDSKAKKSRGQYSFPFVRRCGFWTRFC